MMKKGCMGCLVLLVLGLGSFSALGKDDTLGRAKELFKPIPAKHLALKGNPASPAKVELGKMLFFEPRLSTSYLISCNTCHNVGLGGMDMQETSIGHGWQKGPRNAPTVLNSVYNMAQFWDGRAKDLAEQAKGPVQASVEMNNNPERVKATLKSIPAYPALFKKAFPGEAEPLSFDNMAKAIEVFEATLITPDAPFDRFLSGDLKALSAGEQAGLRLFMDKGCAACHGGINLGGTGYFTFGVFSAPNTDLRPANDMGRFKISHADNEKFAFKSPSLRNIVLTPPYFHSGKVWKLEEAVEVMGNVQLGKVLSPEDTSQIVAFLGSLTGKQPKVVYPILPPNGPTTPTPIIR
ncbi:MAG: cytochrome-c peroxidase [Desulfuromonadaceae bacterium]